MQETDFSSFQSFSRLNLLISRFPVGAFLTACVCLCPNLHCFLCHGSCGFLCALSLKWGNSSCFPPICTIHTSAFASILSYLSFYFPTGRRRGRCQVSAATVAFSKLVECDYSFRIPLIYDQPKHAFLHLFSAHPHKHYET